MPEINLDVRRSSRRTFLRLAGGWGGAGVVVSVLGACSPNYAPAGQTGSQPAATTAPAAVSGAQTTIKFGDIYTAQSHLGQGVDKFAELARQKTGGKVDVQVFHNGTLGSERDEATQVRNGTIQMMETGLAGVGTYVPEISVLELPYLYKSFDQIRDVSAKVKDDLDKLLLDKGVRALAFFYDGPRDVASTKPLKGLADFRGLKFRVPDAAAYVNMAKALGSNPTPTALSEVYTDLQTKVVDAAEGPPDTLFSQKWFEVAKNVTLTDHIYQVLYVLINDQFFKGLPADVQQNLSQAAQEAADFQLGLVKNLKDQRLQDMQQAGATVIQVEDLKPFQDAVRSSNEDFAKQQGPNAVALLQKIESLTQQG